MEDKYEGCSFNSRTIAIAETVMAVELWTLAVVKICFNVIQSNK